MCLGTSRPLNWGECDEAYQLIDDAATKRPLFYRLKLSSHPRREDINRDLDMQKLTRSLMQALEKRLNTPIPWVGALHDDHSPIRHVHLLAILPTRLHVPDLEFLIRQATHACAQQRRALDVGREQAPRRQHPLHQAAKPEQSLHQHAAPSHTDYTQRHVPWGSRSVVQPQPSCTCPRCRFTQTHNRHHHTHPCISCGLILHQGQKLRLQRKEAQGQRSW